jgi:hypothetical protein
MTRLCNVVVFADVVDDVRRFKLFGVRSVNASTAGEVQHKTPHNLRNQKKRERDMIVFVGIRRTFVKDNSTPIQ